MKKIILLVFGILTLWFSGCVPEEAVGVYASPNGQFVVVKKDGSLSWSPASKTENELIFVGIMEINKESKEVHLVMPSAYPLLGTTVSFSADFQELRINWKTLDGKPFEGRSEVYKKRK
jgi:hypothetical protein